LDRLGEPERVLQRDGALELRLHGGTARGREVDLAQALRRLRARAQGRGSEPGAENHDSSSNSERPRTDHDHLRPGSISPTPVVSARAGEYPAARDVSPRWAPSAGR